MHQNRQMRQDEEASESSDTASNKASEGTTERALDVAPPAVTPAEVELLDLEYRYQETHDRLLRDELFEKLRKAEEAYALDRHVYQQLLRPGFSEKRFVRERTRSRMRSRKQNCKLLGLLVGDRAFVTVNHARTKRYQERIDPHTKESVTLQAFRDQHPKMNPVHSTRAWQQLPRRYLPPRRRLWGSERMTWKQCFQQF